MEEEDTVKQALRDLNTVSHLALFGDFNEKNYACFDINIKGSHNLLEATRIRKVKHFYSLVAMLCTVISDIL